MRDRVDEIVEQWAQERPELDVSPVAVIGRISRLAAFYDQAIGANLVEFDLRPDEYDVLATLRRTGSPYALNPRDLLDSMMVSSATMTHRLDKLEKRGLVKREPDPTDRRGVIAKLTPAGKRLIDRAAESHTRMEAGLLAGLTKKDTAELIRLLRILGEADGS